MKSSMASAMICRSSSVVRATVFRRAALSLEKAIQAQTGGEGGCLPMALRDGGPAALAAPGASSQASHFGRCPGFVDKDQAAGVEIGLALEPRQPAPGDVRPLLLGGVRGFF